MSTDTAMRERQSGFYKTLHSVYKDIFGLNLDSMFLGGTVVSSSRPVIVMGEARLTPCPITWVFSMLMFRPNNCSNMPFIRILVLCVSH